VARRRRPTGQNREGHLTRPAPAAAHPNPVVVFIVGLLAPLPMADDGVVAAPRTASREQRQRERFHPGVGLVLLLWQCDKENHGWREGPPLTALPGWIREGPSPSRHIKRKKNTAFCRYPPTPRSKHWPVYSRISCTTVLLRPRRWSYCIGIRSSSRCVVIDRSRNFSAPDCGRDRV
jgi:hypothetical protein